MEAQQIQEIIKIGQTAVVTIQGGHQETGIIERIDLTHIKLRSPDDEPVLIQNKDIIMIKGLKKPLQSNVEEVSATTGTESETTETVGNEAPLPDAPSTAPPEPIAGLGEQPDEPAYEVASAGTAPIAPPPSEDDDPSTEPQPGEPEKMVEPVAPPAEPSYPEELNEIKARFDEGIKNARLKTQSMTVGPTPPEIKTYNSGVKNDITKTWDWIKNKYDSCVAPKKNQAQQLRQSEDLLAMIEKTKYLADQLSPSEKTKMLRYLGYFYELYGSPSESTDAHLQASILANTSQDWLNTAAVAVAAGEKEIACYALSDFFLKEPCTFNKDEWYTYISLAKELPATNTLAAIPTQTKRMLHEDEYRLILESCIYILRSIPELNEKAIYYVQKMASGSSVKDLAQEAIQAISLPPKESFKKLSMEIAQKRVDPLKMLNSTKSAVTPKMQAAAAPQVKPPGQHAYGDTRKEALYAQQILKDLPRAEELFIQALGEARQRADAKGERKVVRDYERLLEQMGRHPQAIELMTALPNKEIEDLQILLTLYIRVKKYPEAVKTAQEILNRINSGTAKVKNPNTTQKVLYQNLGQCYFHLKEYRNAEINFSRALDFEPDNISYKRLIAICLFQEGETERAKKELEHLVSHYADTMSSEYLESIKKGKAAKAFENEALFDMDNLASGNLDNFTIHYLDACELKLINPGKLIEGKYAGNEQDKRKDIDRLEGLTKTLNSNVPEQRSDIYLNAARILYDIKVTDHQFYRFLCRSLNSRGDHYLQDNRPPDTIMTYFLEAARVYDAVFSEDPSYKGDEQDAVNAVCRYLYFSALRRNMVPPVNRNLGIKESCEDIYDKCPDKAEFFDSLPVLFARSPKFAFYSVVKVLFNNEVLKRSAIEYIEKQGITVADELGNLDYKKFAGCWKNITENFIERENKISELVNFLVAADLSTLRLEQNLERIDQIVPNLHHALDRETYFNKLGEIFRLSILLKPDAPFEDRNSHFENILNKSNILKNNILENPTKFSIEYILPILERLRGVIEKAQEELYGSSEPEFEFASGVDYYDHDENNKTSIQIKVKNKAPGPAEQVELTLEPNDDYFVFLKDRDTIKYGTIRGKDEATEIIEVQLRSKAIQEKAFSMNLSVKYKTPWNDKQRVAPGLNSISITVGQAGEFIMIDNPYVPYKIVRDKDMFFGREELIKKICNNIAVQSDKNYVIYGQRRAGKSSVLHHLQAELSKNDNLLVVNIGNIADYLDANLEDKMLYVLLWNILFRIQKELGKKAKSKNLPVLEFRIPEDIDFYNHPAPMNLFSNKLQQLKEEKDEDTHWKDIRIVLLIDEFTYIYTFIVGGEVKKDTEETIPITGGNVPATFMQTWKAILEKGYFSVVLAAQDYYTKFREKFSNELQIIYPEKITYLTRAYAELLIDQPIRIGGKKGETRYRGKAIDQILDLTAGSPFYIQIFCDRLVQYINESKQRFITEANVKVVRDMLVKGTENTRLDKATFDNLLNNGDTSKDVIPPSELEHVLRQIASITQQRQWCKETEITARENMQYDVLEIIKDLELREVIEQSGNGVRIRVGLFKDWLNENRF